MRIPRALFMLIFAWLTIVSSMAADEIIFKDGLTAISNSQLQGGWNNAGFFFTTSETNNHGLYDGNSSAKTITSATSCTLSFPVLDSIGTLRFYAMAMDANGPAVQIRLQVDGGEWLEMASVYPTAKTYTQYEIPINVALSKLRLQLYINKGSTQAGYTFDDFQVTKAFQGKLKVYQLHPMFSDNMVLQREKPINIWGVAPQGEEITLTMQEKSVKTYASSNDTWSVQLPVMNVGGPYTLTMKWSTGERVLTNIYVGDVWVAGGQSNMDFALRKVNNVTHEISQADFPAIRFMRVPKDYYVGHNKAWVSWETCSPELASEMFAIPYYFAKKIYQETGIPIGIIQCALGGTSAESWLPKELLLADPGFGRTLKDYEKIMTSYHPGEYEELYAKWKAGTLSTEPMGPYNFRRPAGVYHTMFEKIVPYSIKGFLWYQGESNVARAFDYIRLFPALITHWRDRMEQGDLPFLFVQLPKFNSSSAWQELREAQRLTESNSLNVGMAVAFDQGNPGDIHPTEKDTVGERLAYVALAKVYNKQIPYLGPRLKSKTLQEDKILLSFDGVEGGLVSRGSLLKGFSICGDSKIFYPADASIAGDQITVSSPRVSQPQHVRYGWFSSGDATLYNQSNLPASPFRTDNYPFVTEFVQEGGLSQESSLNSININGNPLQGFSPSVYEYTVRMGTSAIVPIVSAVAKDHNATLFIEQANSLEGPKEDRTAIVRVTAEDLLTVSEYLITFDKGAEFESHIINASKSTWVNMSSKDANYAGQDMQLRTWASNYREIYLQFDLSDLDGFTKDQIKAASVRLTFKEFAKGANNSINPERKIHLNLAYDTLKSVPSFWEETTLTWNLRPHPSSPILLGTFAAKESSIEPISLMEFPLTDLSILLDKIDKSGKISFYLRETSEATTSTTKEGMIFYSRESAPSDNLKPQLMIQTELTAIGCEKLLSSQISVFSSDGRIHISTDMGLFLDLYTMDGVLVHSTHLDNDISLSLPCGFYLLCFTNGHEVYTKKVIL